MKKINPDIEVIGIYVGALIPIKHYNKICQHTFNSSPSSMLQGTQCPVCHKNGGITEEEYVIALKNKNPNIALTGQYINARTKTEHVCLICGYKWHPFPDNLLNKGCQCPKCANKMLSESFTRSHEEYIQALLQKNSKIMPVDKYINSATKIKHQCMLCGYVYEVSPENALSGKGCPLCCKPPQKIGPPPEFRNSIWASEYKDICSKYLTDEQMQSIMPGSTKKMLAKCPECGREKYIIPYNLIVNSLGCICGDSISYPNKFVYGVLNQLNIDFIPEYTTEWACNKKYDIYIQQYNLIIENHGLQHYIDNPWDKSKSLEDEQSNDLFKESLAKQNGIEEYIILDCRRSSVEWIKHSIMQSKLPIILSFSENDINWDDVDKFATSNFVRKASDLFNKGNSIPQIAKILNVSDTTVRTWVKKALNLSGVIIKHQLKL